MVDGATSAGWSADPSARVEQAYRRIETECMAGLPILNPALRVQALEFQRWRDLWLGVVITSWCMSLVLLPATGCRWTRVHPDERVFYRFPAGTLAFLTSHDPELGEFHTCALFSPMASFTDQDAAVATAREAVRALLASPQPANGAEPADAPKSSSRAPQSQPKRLFLKRVFALNSRT